MKKTKFSFLIFIFFFFCGTAYAMSLTLYNDSPYELTVLIKSANGKLLGQVIIPPGEEKIWNTELSSSTKYDIEENVNQPEQSLTPYIVIWKCPHGGYYSVCTSVETGSTVNANFCPGDHYCRPKKEKKKATEDCPACPVCPPCPKSK